MNTLIKQLILLIIISTVLTFTFIDIGLHIALSIVLSIVIQYAAFNAYKYGLESYTTFRLKKLENEKLKLLAYQVVEAVCPCSQQAKDYIPIRLNRPNYYKCKVCNRTVGIFVSVETALVTEPISDTDLVSIEHLIEEKLNELT